jgi:phenylacetate-coenzyme A ligase PaaK-like adenylate-forming protein
MLTTPELIKEAALPYRLGKVLPRWLREVPLYQRTSPAPLLTGEAISPAELRHLPLITKEDIRRDFPRNFLRAGMELDTLLDQELVELEHTSGTSEERTPLLLGRGWWAEQEERALRLNPFVAGVLNEFPNARRVTINSPVCSGDICYSGVPSRADREVGNALFVSLSRYPFLWGESELARMAAEAAEWRPQFLDVDPVYGVVFALYCERRGIRLPSLRFIVGSYEFVSVVHRRIMERVFGVSVLNLYGSTETGHLLMEAGRGEMRPSHETALLEVLDTDAQGVSELAVTTLTNDYMPLIRYCIGDLVERHERPYCTSYFVHGRAKDAFVLADGRRVTTWQIDQCAADLSGIAHYQLCQRAAGEWLLRFVPDIAAPTAAELDELRRRLEQLLGADGKLAIQQTDLLTPESSGKFRLGYPLR